MPRFNVNVQKRKLFKTPTSNSNPLLTYILSQQKEEDKQGRLREETQEAPQFSRDIKTSFGGKTPVGATFKGGDLTIPLNRELTREEIQTLGMRDAFKYHVSYFKNQMLDPNFRKNYSKATARLPLPFIGSQKGNILGFPTTFGSKEAMLLNFSNMDMSDRLLRLRSGAQINEREYNRMSSLLPSFSDISDPNDTNYEVVNTKLDLFMEEFEKARMRIIEGAEFDENGQRLVYDPVAWGDGDSSQPSVLPSVEGSFGREQSRNNDPLGLFS